ncbi:MAG: glycoside hydrolase family 1 protein [Candidatus Omnitrophica bacterium]|nr:glycoside hydrolase family 1 protein [Candidatus Omnitrophota bacterium]
MRTFPDNFLWGAATSSHQVEGDNRNNDWWEWEESRGTDPSGKACDHYNRYEEDFRIAKALNHNAHRFSVEWSRVEPSEGVWNEPEWDHYDKVIDLMISLKIEPILTLNHFALPLWLARKGGWSNEDIIPFFTRYASRAAQRYGDRVRYWIPINEPQILAFIGYFRGSWPPFKKSFELMLTVIRIMLAAHVSAYAAIKNRARSADIGMAQAVTAFHPCSRLSPLDIISAFLRADFQNKSFVRSAITGKMRFFPYIDEPIDVKHAIDFIGLNYYFREFVHHKAPIALNPFGWVCSHTHHEKAGQRTDMGWEIYPRGIYEVVKSFSGYGLPIMITENGLATCDDELRRTYIKDHLYWLAKAIDEGCPVKGYLHWSLLDNFEWAEGYSKSFGLVDVDFKNCKRTVRESAKFMAAVIRAGRINV